MNIALQFDTRNLHHAYMVVGDRMLLEESLRHFLELEMHISLQGNPDFSHRTFETFGIDDARVLTNEHVRKPFAGGRKICVVSTYGITIEAQNALLKLFEEPIAGNHFFLVIPEDKIIIPTLRSRMVVVRGDIQDTNSELGKVFLRSSIADRLVHVGKIVDSKDKEGAKKLIRSISDEIHVNGITQYPMIVKDLMKAEEYLSDRAPSIKMILEHIAYRIPVTK